MMDPSRLGRDVEGAYSFGVDEVELARELRLIAQNIEDGKTIVPSARFVVIAKTDDFLKFRLNVTFHERRDAARSLHPAPGTVEPA